MLRVFLVIDDYNELIYLQTLLKKIGFDVEGLQNQRKYADLSLGFNPQVLVTTLKGGKVDGVQLAQSIRKGRGLPKIIALKSSGQSLDEASAAAAGIDAVLESPINPKSLLSTLSTLADLDETALLDKFDKMKTLTAAGSDDPLALSLDEGGQSVDEIQKIKSALWSLTGVANVTKPNIAMPNIAIPKEVNDSARAQRFEKCVQEIGPLEAKKFDRDRIREFNKKIRSWPQVEDIEQIEDERKSFVRALFKK